MRTLLVARNDLRRRLRNRSALITAFAGPLALALVFSVLVGGTSSVRFEVGVVDLDGSDVSRSLVTGGDGEGDADVLTFLPLGDVADARRQVDAGEVDSAIVVPSGYGASVESGQALPLTVIRSPERLVSGQVAESVALAIASSVERVTLSIAATVAATGTAPTADLIAAARSADPVLSLEQEAAGGREVSAAAFYGASMSILFMFFTVGFAARSLIAERAGGTLPRMLATGAPARSIVAGKVLAVSTLALCGLATVWLVTALGFGADWGDPLGVAVLMVATVFAIGGVATVVTTLGRTEQQADAYTSVVTFAFALLGGNFIGPGAAPDLLRTLSLATPNGWALRGFTDLSSGAESIGSVAVPIGVLLGIGVAFWAAGLARVRRVVAR